MFIYVVVCYEDTIDGMNFHLVKAFIDRAKAYKYSNSLPRESNEIMSTDFDVYRVRLEQKTIDHESAQRTEVG
jgi:hypothetical protein